MLTTDPHEQRHSSWFTRFTARQIVHGGLGVTTPWDLDADVRRTCRADGPLDITRAEAAELAVSMIRGYVATHPVADEAERRYVAKLNAQRIMRESSRRLRNAAWRFLQYIKAAELASVEFAHAVQKPVDDPGRVIHDDKLDSMAYALHALGGMR